MRGRRQVVVANADQSCGLGIARSLRKADVEMTGLCFDPSKRSARSRLWNRLETTGYGDEEYLEALTSLGGSLPRRTPIFLTSDNWVQLLSHHREELGKYYSFVLPPVEIVDRLLDKTSFHLWAEENGFLVPLSRIVRSAAELDDALAESGYPCILKPTYHVRRWYQMSPEKVIFLKDRGDVDDIAFDPFELSPRMLLQQWIPGGDSSVYFCLFYFNREGVEMGYYVGRKLLQWPPGTGSTALAVGVDYDLVHETAKEVMTSAGCKGLCSLEFKKSEADGRLYIIEPTVGRADLQSYLAVAGGVNLVRMALDDAIGVSRGLPAGRRRSMWLNEHLLLKVIRRAGGQGTKVIGVIVREWRWNISFALFSLHDLRPFLTIFEKMAARILARLRSLLGCCPRRG